MFGILIALVMFAPLPFGGVYPWSWGLSAMVVGALLCCWGAQVMMDRRAVAIPTAWMWLLVALFIGVIGWGIWQTITGIPAEFHQPIWSSAGEALGKVLPGRVTVNTELTISAVTRLMTYAGVFWLALQYGRDYEPAMKGLGALVVAGFLYAGYGIVLAFTDTQRILWFEKVVYETDLTSTFVNRNSYATYAGIGLVCTTGMILQTIVDIFAESRSRRFRLGIAIERMTRRGGLLAIAWVTLLTAVILSHSWAGFVSAILGIVVLCILWGLSRSGSAKFAMIFGVLAVAGAGAMFFFGGADLDHRLGNLLFERHERMQVYELTVAAIQENPIVGTGYGTFASIFTSLRTPDIINFYLLGRNTYLENALELGLPAATLLFIVILGLFLITLRGLRARRQSSIFPTIGAAVTVLVAFHALFDFSIQIPAVAMTYSFLMGIACAGSSRRKQADEPEPPAPLQTPVRSPGPPLS